MDIVRPRSAPALAILLENLGYHRFWTTEHHTETQSGSPIILATAVASVTTRIRVGTAGVMLRYTSPFKVAEDFALLEALYPKRIDLGTISGVVRVDDVNRALLDGREEDAPSSYDRKSSELVSLVRGETSPGLSSRPGPVGRTVPDIWHCALGEQSVRRAASLSVGLAYHRHLARQAGADGAGLMDLYRSQFRQSEWLAEPTAVVACYGSCAENEQLAKEAWRKSVGNLSSPCFVGRAEDCVSQLAEIAKEYSVSEIVIQCFAPGEQARRDAYRELAIAAGLRDS
jgi:luciferase family oxidoreductase group 1